MKRSVPLWTALLLAGCGFPYTPRALPPLSTRDPAAASPANAYTPPRQTELAAPIATSPHSKRGEVDARSGLRR